VPTLFRILAIGRTTARVIAFMSSGGAASVCASARGNLDHRCLRWVQLHHVFRPITNKRTEELDRRLDWYRRAILRLKSPRHPLY
jgi:hypothetical protein